MKKKSIGFFPFHSTNNHCKKQNQLCRFASVLYLFNSSDFGGTLFFQPVPDAEPIAGKFVPSYANCTHPPTFRCIGGVEPAYNTMALYPSHQVSLFWCCLC
jgi:hypothetical protein